MELVETYALQDQLQVVNVMNQMRWGQMDENYILVILDNIQFASGFIHPVLAETNQRLEYIDQAFWYPFGKE